MAVIEAIATTYLEADAGNITWSSIPQTYEHLQIRASFQDHNATNSATNFTLAVYFNNDNSYARFATHMVRAYGSTDTGYAHASWAQVGYMGAEPDIPRYAGVVLDILDYTNANKKTVVSGLNGYVGTVNNVSFGSSLWHTASSGSGVNDAVTQIMLHSPGGAGLLRGGSATLYGLKSS